MTHRNNIIGYILTGFFAAFMTFDGIIHVLRIQPVVDSAVELGYPVNTMLWIGIIELVALALYLWPRTSILGAVLLTGFLGGAIASQFRIEAFGPIVFALAMAALMWGGLWLRDERLRTLMPLRRRAAHPLGTEATETRPTAT